MFSDYKIDVLDCYERKRKAGSLSSDLTHPSPGKIKRQCQVVFETRPAKTDMKIIADFFGHQESETEYLKAIRTIDVDKFRPLVSFVKGTVKDPDERIIELLAWLIDFKPRPFKFDYKSERINTDNDLSKVDSLAELTELEQQGISGGEGYVKMIPEMQGKSGWSKAALAIVKRPVFWVPASFVIATIRISLKRPEVISTFLGTSYGCMYWTGTNYTAVACDKVVADTLVIGLNESRLTNFRKIVDLASVDESDVGKVWYYKIHRDEIECYTGSGRHPELPEKHLKPLTKYMYDKYIYPLKK